MDKRALLGFCGQGGGFAQIGLFIEIDEKLGRVRAPGVEDPWIDLGPPTLVGGANEPGGGDNKSDNERLHQTKAHGSSDPGEDSIGAIGRFIVAGIRVKGHSVRVRMTILVAVWVMGATFIGGAEPPVEDLGAIETAGANDRFPAMRPSSLDPTLRPRRAYTQQR